MARVDDVERRLLNWVRWRAGSGSGGMGFARSDMAAGPGRDGYRESVIPTVDCEAEETDRAVMALPSELRATVESFYLGRGTILDKANRLCCRVPTVYARIDRAHRVMQAWLADLVAARKAQRERVEALQRQARP